MKIKFHPLGFLGLVLAVLSFIAGCATTDYYRLNQTRNDIDAAMTRYRNDVSFQMITPSTQSQVNAAYQAYQAAFDTAVQQAHSNYDAPTPDNVKQLADQLLSLLGAISAVP